MPSTRSKSKAEAEGLASPSPKSISSTPAKSKGKKEESNNHDVSSTAGYTGIKHSAQSFEFGGPIGVTALMIWSHYIIFYFW